MNQLQFANLLGVSSSSISLVEREEAPPPFEALVRLACLENGPDMRALLCNKPGVLSPDALEVASGVKPIIRPLSDNLHDLPLEGVDDDYKAVPLVEGSVAAGPGAVAWDKVRSLVWVYRPELKQRKNLVAIQVVGDSMSPTIPNGAIIIIDKDNREPRGKRKAIWALRTEDGECQIKRLQHHQPQTGRTGLNIWLIISDNPDYPPEIAWTGDFDRLIIGQVIWMWRSLL